MYAVGSHYEDFFTCDTRGTNWNSQEYGRAHSLVKLADPSNDQLEVSSCSLSLNIKHKHFTKQMSNTVLIQVATSFDPDATYSAFNKYEHPSIIYEGSASKEVPVSPETPDSFSVDLTELCKQMHQENKYYLYFSFKND